MCTGMLKNMRGLLRSYLCSLLSTLWEGYLPFKKRKNCLCIIKLGQCIFLKEKKYVPFSIFCEGIKSISPSKIEYSQKTKYMYSMAHKKIH